MAIFDDDYLPVKPSHGLLNMQQIYTKCSKASAILCCLIASNNLLMVLIHAPRQCNTSNDVYHCVILRIPVCRRIFSIGCD